MSKELDQVELRSEEVQDILTKVPHWMIRWGSLLFLILIMLFFILSWFIRYPDVIQSEAYLTTQIPPQKVYARLTGRIDSIFVEPNQNVSKGQILGLINNTANFEDIQTLSNIMDTLNLQKDKFQFPIDHIPLLFLGEVESDYAAFETSYLEYIVNRDLKPFSNEAKAQKSTISELKLRLENIKAQIKINKRELDYKARDIERNQTLFEKGVISAKEYESKQIEFLQAKRNFESLESSISQIREAISSARMNSKSITINQTRENLSLLRKVFQSYNQLKKSIADWKYKYILRSELNGKVTFLNYWNKNQTVQQGDVIFNVIPATNADYIAKLFAPSRNAGKIKKGQRVNIRLDNYPDTEFGTISGAVKNISEIPSKEGFYLIDVEIPEKLITSYNKEIDFRSEMTATAEIVTEDLRLLERFLYQFRELREM